MNKKEKDSAIAEHAKVVMILAPFAEIGEQMEDDNHGDGRGPQEIEIRIVLLKRFDSGGGFFIAIVHRVLLGRELRILAEEDRTRASNDCVDALPVAGKVASQEE